MGGHDQRQAGCLYCLIAGWRARVSFTPSCRMAAATISFSDMVYWFLRCVNTHATPWSLLTTPMRASRRGLRLTATNYRTRSLPPCWPRFFSDGFVASSVIHRRWLQPREKGNRGWNFLVNLVDGFRGVGFRTLWEGWENFCERSRGWLTINKGDLTRFVSFKRLWNCKGF